MKDLTRTHKKWGRLSRGKVTPPLESSTRVPPNPQKTGTTGSIFRGRGARDGTVGDVDDTLRPVGRNASLGWNGWHSSEACRLCCVTARWVDLANSAAKGLVWTVDVNDATSGRMHGSMYGGGSHSPSNCDAWNWKTGQRVRWTWFYCIYIKSKLLSSNNSSNLVPLANPCIRSTRSG